MTTVGTYVDNITGSSGALTVAQWSARFVSRTHQFACRIVRLLYAAVDVSSCVKRDNLGSVVIASKYLIFA